ncbi:MAG: lycopene cyclase family protein, partial [Pseudomonadota bacterium]
MGTIAEPQTPTDARAAARPAMQSAPAYDIIFVGAGLANCLIALRLLDEAPDVNFLVLERADRVGGDTTWSFHETDVTADQEHWLRD